MTDNVDLSHVRWVAGKYDEREIENLFVFERAVAVKRVGNVVKAIEKYCLERAEIIGIVFCLTKKHAEFMSDIFNKLGIPSEFLIAESEDGVRDNVKRRLVTRHRIKDATARGKASRQPSLGVRPQCHTLMDNNIK